MCAGDEEGPVVASFYDRELQPVGETSEQILSLPDSAGVYAIYDAEETLQFIGISRKVTAFCTRCKVPRFRGTRPSGAPPAGVTCSVR